MGGRELKFEPHAKVARPHDFVSIALEETFQATTEPFRPGVLGELVSQGEQRASSC